jgi:predicted DNA binding protein
MTLTIAELDIRHLDCFSSYVEAPATGAHVASDRHGDVFALHAPDGPGLDEFYTRVGQQLAQTPRVLARTQTDIILRTRVSAHGVDASIVRAGGTVLLPAAFAHGHEYYRVLAPDKPTLSAIVKDLRGVGDVEVASVKAAEAGALDVAVPAGSFASGLTAKQLDLVQFAQAQGYYDIPRGATTAQLAKSIGLDRSTVDEHLRKAERAIVRSTLRYLAAHPVLTRGLAKRRGRPSSTRAGQKRR